jgi:hypothetical protein
MHFVLHPFMYRIRENRRLRQVSTGVLPHSVVSVHDVETNLPLLAGARALMGPHTGPHAAAAAAAATVTSLPPLQPRAATTGSTDLLFPLQVQCVCKHALFLHKANLNNYLEKDKHMNGGSPISYEWLCSWRQFVKRNFVMQIAIF